MNSDKEGCFGACNILFFFEKKTTLDVVNCQQLSRKIPSIEFFGPSLEFFVYII